jgi:hypothetical protein
MNSYDADAGRLDDIEKKICSVLGSQSETENIISEILSNINYISNNQIELEKNCEQSFDELKSEFTEIIKIMKNELLSQKTTISKAYTDLQLRYDDLSQKLSCLKPAINNKNIVQENIRLQENTSLKENDSEEEVMSNSESNVDMNSDSSSDNKIQKKRNNARKNIKIKK